MTVTGAPSYNRSPANTATWDIDEAKRLRTETNPETGRLWSLNDLSKKYGVKPQAIGQRLRRHGAPADQAVRETRLLPWTVANRHNNDYMAMTLRLYVKRDRGVKLSEKELAQLQRFLTWLQSLWRDPVVTYDPATLGGWVFRNRRKSDPSKGLLVP